MSTLSLPPSLKEEYPFKPHFFTHVDGLKQHYLDEGEGENFLLLHGNPTWSFYYRRLIRALRGKYRLVAPDHIGLGLSDRPQGEEYHLKKHIDRICALVHALDLKNITLVLHDWGGAIGMGLATRYPERIKRTILLNTAAFRSHLIPWRIKVCRTPLLGEWFIRRFNGFALPATFMAVTTPLGQRVREGYLFPYNNYKNRIGTAKFVQDIPMNEEHPSYDVLKKIETALPNVPGPKLLLWGKKDFCFTTDFYNRWLDFYPQASGKVFPKAGHYVLEDEPEGVIHEILSFVEGNR